MPADAEAHMSAAAVDERAVYRSPFDDPVRPRRMSPAWPALCGVPVSGGTIRIPIRFALPD